MIALDAASGGLIGLVGAEVLNRPGGKAGPRWKRAADSRESRRWLRGTETAGSMLAEAASITMVEDREGDIYDQFARRPANVHLLVRAARDRSVWPALPAAADGEAMRLFAHCATWPEAERYTVSVPHKRHRITRAGVRSLMTNERRG